MLLDFISSTTTFLLFTTKDTCHQSLKERLRHWKLLMNFLCFSIEFDHRPPSKFRHHYLSRFRDSVLPGTYKQISCSHFNYTDLDLLLLGPNVVSSSLPVIPYPGNLGASGTTLETESKTFENLQWLVWSTDKSFIVTPKTLLLVETSVWKPSLWSHVRRLYQVHTLLLPDRTLSHYLRHTPPVLDRVKLQSWFS